MTNVMEGVKVLEVASWTFVPAAGAILADWGADVIKVEHPLRPDPQRGHVHAGLAGARSYIMEQSNRGKRSLALDISTPAGRDVLLDIARTSDVFLTNFLPAPRQKLGIDVDDIRAVNPSVVYVRGSGMGHRGPERDRAGFDGTAYVARSSFADGLRPADHPWPIQGTAAVGDLPGAMTIAGGIAAALFHRERTGEAATVDVSLLAVGMWTMAPDIVATRMYEVDEMPRPSRETTTNPITIQYRTKDDRFVKLSMFESDRYWVDLVEHLGRAELADDARFADHARRAANSAACVAVLDEAFGALTIDEVRQRFETLKGAWGIVQTARELHDDVQAIANGYLVPAVPADHSAEFTLVANPVQFGDEELGSVRPCPGHGEQTDEILQELGYDWDRIIDLKVGGAVL